MKVLVAGSRSITNCDLSPYIPENTDLIIAGGASGIDNIAEIFADKHNISKLILRPQYQRYKKAAPLKRNEQMVDIADMVIVIWDGKSKGSQFTIEYAQKQRKPIKIITL